MNPAQTTDTMLTFALARHALLVLSDPLAGGGKGKCLSVRRKTPPDYLLLTTKYVVELT